MKRQALRPVALMLSLLLVAAVPAQAGTIHLADVIQLAAETRRGTATDLRLRSIQQQGGPTVASGVTPANTQGKGGGAGQNTPPDDSVPSAMIVGDTTASIIQDPAPQQGGQVETIDLGDVTGTVCDCGEIPVIDVPGGGVPWWPFLALGGIPLFFINGGDNPGPTPTITPPTDVIPEPATLMLFGTSLLALGAGARRRRRHNKSLNVDTDGAGEV